MKKPDYTELDNQIAQLFPQVQAGDEQAYEDLILALQPMAKKVAKHFLKQQGITDKFLSDDLQASAIFKVVECCDKVRRGKCNSATFFRPYVYRRIRGYLLELVIEDGVIRIPRRSRKRLEESELISTLSFDEVTCDPAYTPPEAASMEFLEEILTQCHTKTQQQIIVRLSEGYSQTEVGKELGMTQQSVHAQLRRLRQRCAEHNYFLSA